MHESSVLEVMIYSIKPNAGPVIRVGAHSISKAIETAIGHGIDSESDVLNVETRGLLFIERNLLPKAK